jgi:hypothetical protein
MIFSKKVKMSDLPHVITPGCYVECIDDKHWEGYLRRGEIYEVTGLEFNGAAITIKGSSTSFEIHRFKLRVPNIDPEEC